MEYRDIIETISQQRTSDLICINCGRIPYEEALTLQSSLQRQRMEDTIPDTILILEHPPVITLGIRNEHNKLLEDRDMLHKKGIHVVQIHRGGGSTAHNPGQLVVYPIINLTKRRLRVVPYIRFLEALGIELSAHYGVKAYRRNRYPGVWVGGKKIGSIGVQITKGVTMHGIAFNVSNDLDIFSKIIPCGIEGVRMTSLTEETGKKIAMTEIYDFTEMYCRDFFSKNDRSDDK